MGYGVFEELEKIKKKQQENKYGANTYTPNVTYVPDTDYGVFNEVRKINEKRVERADSFRSKLQDKRKKEDDDDIAPVKGLFEDGYDFGDVTKSILGIGEDSASFKDLTWNSLKRGYYNARYGEETFAAMNGGSNNKEAYKKLLEGEEYQFTPGNKFAEGVSGAFELLGQQARQFTNPRTIALTGAAAGAAAIAGQAGPQVLVPEEVVTVPAAATAAFAAGSAASNLEIEAGHAYNEMLEAGIEEKTARKVALGVGVVNAGLEMLQVDELLDAYKVTKASGATKTFTKRIFDELLDRGIDVAKETGQEVIQEGVTIAGVQGASKYEKGEWAYNAEEVEDRLKDTAASSALSFGIMNAPATAKNISSIAADQKKVNAAEKVKLTQNEQAVVKKEIENRIAEAEKKNGKKLTGKEKAAIEARVEEDLEKGYISTDTIEEVLGGEDYKKYKETVDSESAQIKGDRLIESYNEKNRVFEDFKADYDKFKGAKHTEAAKKTLDNAIKAGANNTNRVRDFVEMTAKLSGDTGEVFEFKSGDQIKADFIERQTKEIAKIENIPEDQRSAEQNKMLAEMKTLLANVQSGKTVVNGDISGGRIVLNLDSAKPLNRTVGHEITHRLEKAKSYESLRDTLFTYAKTKGIDVDGKLSELKAKYAGVTDANPEAELVADLVGDFLFEDADFVSNLAVNDRNVFQKIYDEIKHLLKVATAGSKEARELERVKRAFDKAYREAGAQKNTADGGGKYSLLVTDKNGNATAVDPATTTRKQTHDYLVNARKGELDQYTYFPVSPRTSGTIISTLGNAGIEIADKPLAMQAKKARQSQNEGQHIERDGTVIRHHAMTPAEIQEVIDKLDDPFAVIHQQDRVKKKVEDGKTIYVPAPDNFVFFVTLDSGKECVAVIEFDSHIDEKYIQKDGHGDDYHTTVTVFEPDQYRDGEDFDYLEYLALQQSNSELEIIKESPKTETAISQTQATVPELGLSNAKVAQNDGTVKREYSLSDSNGRQLTNEQQDYFKDSVVRDENGNLKVMYHGTSKGGYTVFDTYGSNHGLFGAGSYFTDSKTIAESYTKKGKGKNPQVYETYLNIKNPIDMDAAADPAAWAKAFPDADFPESGTNEDFYRAMEEYFEYNEYSKWEASDIAVEAIEGMGYDGVTHIGGGRVNADGERHRVYIALHPEQIKNVDNQKPTADPDIRFSLSNAVEETKDLVALHNLTADKLTKSLELGGLPMPSLAITKADIPHSNFGEITLVFGKETIDPKKNKKNKAYSADAWTPVFPRVEYEADSKVANKISQKLRELEGSIDDIFQRDIRRIQFGFEDYLNSQGGEEGLIKYAMENYGLKAAYLEEQGKHIEKVTAQKEVEKDYNPNAADKYQKIMDILGVSTAEEIGKVNLKDARDNHGTELEAVYPGVTKTAMRMGRIFNAVKSFLEDQNGAPVYQTVTDDNATRRAVDEALDAEGFETWTRNLFAGIVKDSGIYNNKELFTPSGNRRSFKQTHLPVTLENIVKAMASQNNGNAKNVSGFNGIKTLRAATAETFKSVADMHQRKDRLQHLTEEQATAIQDALHTRLFKIIETIDNEGGQIGERNPYIRYDYIGETIAEIGEGGKYNVADIQKAFQQYGKEISDDTAMEVKQLLYDVTQMPVNIFEAKPERVVSFDEAKAFVVPNNLDTKLKQELLNRGYSIAEYDPNVEGDRQRVVNQFEEYRFSLADAADPVSNPSSFDVYGKDFRKQQENEIAPVQEDIAPVAENSTVQAKTQLTEDNSIAEMFPDEPTIQTELDSLIQEQEALEARMMDMANTGDFSEMESIDARWKEIRNRIGELENEISETESARLDSINDEDVPPEMDAPYFGESNTESVPDPFIGRDMDEVAKNRKVKAYQYENPEVKPFFQEAANAMIGDLNETVRGEKIFNEDLHYESGGEHGWMGTKRQTTEDIAWLKDTYGYTYDQIRDGVNAIIEDDGKENNAVSKRIEFLLHDRLVNGYTGVFGDPIPANQDYINFLKEREINEYSKEAFDSFMTTADQYAPEEDIAPVAAPAAKTAAEVTEDIAPTYDVVGQKNVPDGQQAFLPDAAVPEKVTRKVLHKNIVENVKAIFKASGFDFDKVLKDAKNLSTFATVDNTPQRVMEKALGYKAGGVLADLTVNKVAQNETEGIKWLNSFTDRKNGLLAQISKQYNIKPGSKQSAAAQMYAEGFYVGENDEIIAYGDKELAADFPDVKVQRNIKGLANDPRIRKIYDETLAAINESRARNAYPEIPRLDNYFLHFRAMEDTFSRLGLPFNPNDIRAKDLPTDLNGVTADLKPGQPYFASAMHRTGKRTSFDLLGGLEKYLSSAKNQIYHIDDIQTLRALRNYVADTYGQANGLEGLDALNEEEAQQRIEQVYNSHLSTFAKFLNEEANVLAGKTALIDRGLEGIIGRRGITFLNTVNGQVGKNMVGYNISSSLTNVLPVVQTFAKTNKADFTKAFAQTVGNKIGSIFGRSDGFTENSPVAIRRKGADTFYRTAWQKISDPGYALMSAIDNTSTELIARTKYNEFTRKGMTSQQAHIETDKWVSRLMGDRSLGQQPQLYNSKMLGLLTKFQLEVRNQLDSQFYDTIQETKVSNEDIQNGLLRNAKTAAKVGSTFFQLAVAQHLFGKAFEYVAGYNPAFDIIEVLIKAFGWDDEEESEDTVLDNIEQGFFALLEDLPYTSTLTGGRIPISSALPITELIKGEDQYGNEKSRWETFGEVAPYYLMPGGYGQVKKSVAGLNMFDDDLPMAGSYTDSGNLRFPVEDTPINRAQAAIFGQWASENAGDYIDNKRSPLNQKQIREFDALDIPISDYWKYREEAKDIADKAEKDNATDEIILKSKYLNSVNTELSNLMNEEKEIADDPKLSEKEKQKRIRDIQNRFDELSREGFNSYNTVTIDGDYAKVGDRYFQWYTPEEGEPYWRKLTDQQKTKYLVTKAAGDAAYATDGNVHYRRDSEGEWTKISDNQLERQNEVTKALGITPEEYWSKTDISFLPMPDGEYEYAVDNPENYAVAKAVGGYDAYKKYSADLYNIKADKDSNGKSISGSRKTKVMDYINGLDADYYTKLILYKSEYTSYDDENYEIIEYLNERDDISGDEMRSILLKLGFKVDSEGYISW